MRKWLTTNEVCEKLRIDRSTLHRLEKRGEFPKRSDKLKTPRWPDDEIERHMLNESESSPCVP